MTLTTSDKREISDNSGHWPKTILEAYARWRGPYTIENAETLLQEEPLELYNGWLVWQAMTDAPERRAAAIIQEVLSMAARAARFGQAYPDQFECLLENGDTVKPDVCLISDKRYKTRVAPSKEGRDHKVLHGGPELAVEMRSPSNTRAEERAKRDKYFENGTLIVWDVDPYAHKIWVYEVENPEKPREFKEGDTIDCERLLPGWRRKIDDFFSQDLIGPEQILGEIAEQWRAESRAEGKEAGKAEGRVEGLTEGRAQGLAEGRAEGELEALKKVLLRLARLKFGAEQLPADLETRLNNYSAEQLNQLTDKVAISSNLAEWLAAFP